MAVPRLDLLPYTIQNLPYGVISTAHEVKPHCAIAIGEHAVDLAKYIVSAAERLNKILDALGMEGLVASIFQQHSLNEFAKLPRSLRQQFRTQLQDDLKNGRVPEDCLVLLTETRPHLPMNIGGFSDFYTSLEHCQNCSGALTTTGIPKNWFHAPSAYNGRASSIVPTPTDIHRPRNVYFTAGWDSEPGYGPSRKLDFELEMGVFVSTPIKYGDTLPIADAKEHIFGFVMLNDWSARDHQLFEMRPLGPFHSKSFGTSISNWIIPIEALEPFSCAVNTKQDPTPFEHLTWPTPEDAALDVKLRVKLIRDGVEKVLSTSNLKYLYWTPYQQLTHQAASGCGVATGDLLGTGTISGSGTNEQGEKAELGCLYEAERTKTAIMPQSKSSYDDGYIEDGDEIVLEGWCEDGRGNVVLGFGECRGRIVPPK